MQSNTNPIPQPPHSAGLEYKGLRPRIDPAQVPSPIDAIEFDRQAWEDKVYYPTLPGTHAPLCTSDYVAIDQGNSSPKFIRMSTWNVPSTSKLANDCKIPICAAVQPFADLDPREDPAPRVDFGADGPPRCGRCRAYVNPWCTFVAGGMRWKCNLCSHETEVHSEYFSNLDPNGLRLDQLQRPELTKGTVDFVVTDCEQYWGLNPPPRINSLFTSSPIPEEYEEKQPERRKPQPLDYAFAFDVTSEAHSTGFLHAACEALRAVLFSPTFPPDSRVAFITYDTTIHFYDIQSNSTLICSDLEDIFIPLPPSALFVNPSDPAIATVIHTLLDTIPTRFSQQAHTASCLGPAILSSIPLFTSRGGHVLVFQSILPTIGIGALPPTPPDEVQAYSQEKETALHQPRSPLWANIADECVQSSVGVSLFLAPSKFIDVASIGVVASQTGGEIFFHPRFSPPRDGPIMESQLFRLMGRGGGYDCTMRVRCSIGLHPTTYLGPFVTSPQPSSALTSSSFAASFTPSSSAPPVAPDVPLPLMDADKSVNVVFRHRTRKLDPRGMAFVQFGCLYTDGRTGERKVRVLNLALNVVEMAVNVFQYADMETVLSVMSKEAMDNMKKQRSTLIREELTEKTAEILIGYRTQCAAGMRNTQLVIPEAFRALPAFTLALQKTKPLKARQVSSDVRNYQIHRILSMSPRTLIHTLYPRLLALHDLEHDVAVPISVPVNNGNEEGRQSGEAKDGEGEVVIKMRLPSCMRDAYYFMEAHGVYLIDNEEMMVVWVGASASPQLLQDLFGVDDIYSLDPHMTTLPALPTLLSTQLHNILAHRAAQRGYRQLRVYVARQNLDAAEIEFSDMLVEDTNNGAMSYMDYLATVHKQMTHVLNSGGAIASANGFRAAPW